MLPDVTVAAEPSSLPHNWFELVGLLIVFARGFFTDRGQNEALSRIEENSMKARIAAESANRKAWRVNHPGQETPDPITVYGKPIPKGDE